MIVPWCVDVPQDRWPVVNWLIIAGAVCVFALQIAEAVEGHPGAAAGAGPQAIGGIVGAWMLNGWGLRGLLGHMWVHGGVLHLLGNMWFLWIFGNAVCAKVGNLRYLLLYVLLGVAAGVTHLLFDSDPAIGASGAINGVVGMYLVLFYENGITCYWAPILIYWRQFTVSSFWMILMWLIFDIYGAARGGSGVAYFAHLGGFGAGFGVALYMCMKGWITMERYEKSLWQWWQQRKGGPPETSLEAAFRAARQEASLPASPESVSPARPLRPVPLLSLNERPASDGRVHLTCVCGKSLRLSRQYAGQTVCCPACGAELTVERDRPSASQGDVVTPDDGFIRFVCTCGRRMKVPSRYAGRSGKCPRCGVRVTIPRASL